MASKRSPHLQAFTHWLSYSLSHVDFEKVEEDGMLDTYFMAMEFFEDEFGGMKKNDLTQQDIEFLLALQNGKPATGAELCEKLSITPKTVANRIAKATEKMMIQTFYEKKTRFYVITDYGRKRLRDEIIAMEEIE